MCFNKRPYSKKHPHSYKNTYFPAQGYFWQVHQIGCQRCHTRMLLFIKCVSLLQFVPLLLFNKLIMRLMVMLFNIWLFLKKELSALSRRITLPWGMKSKYLAPRTLNRIIMVFFQSHAKRNGARYVQPEKRSQNG